MKRVVLALMLGSLLVVGSVAHAASRGGYSPTLKVDLPALASTADGGTSDGPYVVEGCGYNGSFGGVTVVVHSPEAISFAGQLPDADGCIWVTNFSTQGAGHYTVDAFQHIKNRDKLVASTDFDW